MKVRIDGRGIVDLTRRNFVAAGGEGRVWVVGTTAVKVYHEPSRALSESKLARLKRVRHVGAIVPQALVRRPTDGVVIGHTMRHVPDAWAWAQMVPTTFWDRHGLTLDTALGIADALARTMEAVHATGAVVVDLNDTNVLVDPRTHAPALIDVDSWQTPGDRATAATPGFVDPHAAAFSPATDWYSHAILTFCLLAGMHPFKGKHPSVVGLPARMRAGISAFDPAVRRPAACRSLDAIPPAWRAWLQDVLGAGERRPPPPRVPVPACRPRRSRAPTIRTRDGATLTATFDARHGRVALTADVLVLPGVLPLPARGVVAHDDTLYVLGADKLLAVDPVRVGDRIIAGLRPVAEVMPHASTLWPGVVMQDLLGTSHATLLRDGGALTLALTGLPPGKILTAAYAGGELRLTSRRGQMDETWVFRGDPAIPGAFRGRRDRTGSDSAGAAPSPRKRSVTGARTGRGNRKQPPPAA
jgi:hypothetical protein